MNLSPSQSRLIEAGIPYAPQDIPQQKDGILCGWHSLRASWLLADKHITKFHTCDLKVGCDPLKQRSRRYTEGCRLLKLERSKKLASAFDKISISDTNAQIRAAMLRAVSLHALTQAEQKNFHVWNEMSPRFDRMSRKNHRSYALAAQNASRLQTIKRSFQQTQTMELRSNLLKPNSKHIRYASPLNLTIATTESVQNTHHRSLIDL